MDPRADRLSRIAPFEVMEVLALAQRLEAEGNDVIHLEVGEPDFPTPERVVEAAARAMRDRPMGYTPALGLPDLREAISGWYAAALGADVAPERIVVTSGSSAALLLALGAAVNPGDRVAMGDPGYPCNRHFAAFVEGDPLLVPTHHETAYQLTAELLEAAWDPGVRAVIAASPSNPTGTLVPLPEWRRLAALCADRGAVLIADEIYQGLTYGRDPETVLSVSDDVVVVNSFSKYFQMTGWRVGWLVVPPGWVRDIEKLAQNLFISPSAPAQYGALAAFRPETLAILEERRDEFRRRRDFLVPELEKLGFRIPVKPEGAFYVYADIGGLAEDGFELAGRLIESAGVAATPGLDFGLNAPQRHMRFAYTVGRERLREGLDRMARLLRP